MRITGIVLVLIGLIAGAITVAALVAPIGAERPEGMGDNTQTERTGAILPLVVCGAMVVLGAVVYMFGGRSHIVSNDPRVRN